MPPEMKHLFLVSGGALAVENALKAAFDWKVRKNLAAGKGEKGSQVIHLREAFHGRSGYTLSLTNTADPRKWMYFPKFDWPRIITRSWSFRSPMRYCSASSRRSASHRRDRAGSARQPGRYRGADHRADPG